MSFWSVMNWVAWAMCLLIAVLLTTDFIRVEKEHFDKKK